MKTAGKFVFGCGIFVACGILISGCTTESQARAQARDAFFAGQNAALQQRQSQMPSVTVLGAVQNPHVPWVAGLTLTQALATANYLDQQDPKQIVITRDGESAALKPEVLFNGAVVPLEAGDVIELRQ